MLLIVTPGLELLSPQTPVPQIRQVWRWGGGRVHDTIQRFKLRPACRGGLESCQPMTRLPHHFHSAIDSYILFVPLIFLPFVFLFFLVSLIGLKWPNKIAYHPGAFHTTEEPKAAEIWSKTEIGSLMSEETIWTWSVCVVRLQMNSI